MRKEREGPEEDMVLGRPGPAVAGAGEGAVGAGEGWSHR